VTYTYFEI